ncbi:MAG: carboxymuconolactone decarboxylase family protein [Desulfovibrionaceae bacterium]|jgi:4-carboxymuconolactone decarboxylase
MRNERLERGLKMLERVDGRSGGEVLEAMERICPDMGRYIAEFAFGDVYSRPGLGLREREIATVAALTALGSAQPQLKVHVHGALNVGVTRTEVLEIILQMAVYAGFPAALNALFTTEAVFRERDAEGRE